MSQLKQEMSVAGATVPFYTYTQDGTEYYEFDTSRCGPPEPMVNAMAGLKLVTDPSKKLVMINHKKPMGLFDKIGENFHIETEETADGYFRLIFSYMEGQSNKADLSETSCAG